MNDKPAYRPTHVEYTSGYNDRTGAHKVYRVHFQHSSGIKDYVEIPATEYNAENVQQHLERAAMHHEQVMSLRPGYTPPQSMPATDPWGNTS